MITLNIENILSGFYGLAIGDAVGVPVEFISREILSMDPVTDMREYGTHYQPKGTWSDDTTMSIATLKAMSTDGLSYNKIMENFKSWYHNASFTAHNELFDIGIGTSEAIFKYRIDNAINCGSDSFYNNGNGSLMRMLPFVYYIYFKEWKKADCKINDNIRDIVYKASSITHAHNLSKMSCLYYITLGLNILDNKDNMSLKEIIEKSIIDIESYYAERNEDIEIYNHIQTDNLLDSMKLDIDDLKSSGYVIHSLETSIWCLYNTQSYKESILSAVNLGEDTDTIAAITGSLAGMYYGLENIPKEWIKELKNKELINQICNEFYNEYRKKKVAFICVHNSCRSQIAEALGKKYASDNYEFYSAGTETKPEINQDAVRLMKELHNIDMEKEQYSKLLSDIPSVDIVITMGCNVECPYLPCEYREDWGLEDPTGKDDIEFEKTIRTIEEKIKEMAE